MASVKKNSNSKSRSVIREEPMAATRARGAAAPFAVCVCNDEYAASLELRKLYRVIDDTFADEHDMIRVIDESDEDYLYPKSYFVRVHLPREAEIALQKIA